MSHTRTHAADGNQAEIVRILRALGCQVVVLSQVGGGVPDLLIGWHGVWLLMEIKTAARGLSPEQQIFLTAAQGPVSVVRSVPEAIHAVNSMVRR